MANPVSKKEAVVNVVEQWTQMKIKHVIVGVFTAIGILLIVTLLIKQGVEIASLKDENVRVKNQLNEIEDEIRNIEETMAIIDDVESLENDTKLIEEQLKNYSESNDVEIKTLQSDVNQIKTDVQKEREKWPSGAYCVTNNYSRYSCPAGLRYNRWHNDEYYCCK